MRKATYTFLKTFARQFFAWAMIILMNYSGLDAVTYAMFGGSVASSGNSFTAATLDISASGGEFSGQISASSGSEAAAAVAKASAESLDFYYETSVSGAAGDLCPKLDLRALIGAYGSGDSDLQTFNVKPADPFAVLGGDWNFTASLKDGATDWEGKTCDFNIVFKGTQNADGTGFSDTVFLPASVASAAVQSCWIQTAKSDFDAGSQLPPGSLDTSASPGSVLLDAVRPNLAITGIARASSNGYNAYRAKDSDNSTYWRSAGGVPQWVKIDLGSEKTVNQINLLFSVGSTGSERPKNYKLQTSADADCGLNGNETFADVVSVADNAANNPAAYTFADVNARCVRLYITAVSGGTRARVNDMKIYGPAAYLPSGSLTSSGFDSETVKSAGNTINWQSISWNAATPAETSIAMDISTSNGGMWSSWTPVVDNPAGLSGLANPNARFIRWRATLAGDTSVTPALNEVKVCYTVASPVKLNEFLPNPSGSTYGNDGDSRPKGEWVELYSASGSSIDLTGWKIKASSTGKTILIDNAHAGSHRNIGHDNDWLVVYLNGETLDNTADTIRLYDAHDNLIDSYSYDLCDSAGITLTPDHSNGATVPAGGTCASVIPDNKSYARIPDGGPVWYDPIPTPGAPNELEELEVPAPEAATTTPETVLEETVPAENAEIGETSEPITDICPIDGPVQESADVAAEGGLPDAETEETGETGQAAENEEPAAVEETAVIEEPANEVGEMGAGALTDGENVITVGDLAGQAGEPVVDSGDGEVKPDETGTAGSNPADSAPEEGGETQAVPGEASLKAPVLESSETEEESPAAETIAGDGDQPAAISAPGGEAEASGSGEDGDGSGGNNNGGEPQGQTNE